jgi:antitoxin CptB
MSDSIQQSGGIMSGLSRSSDGLSERRRKILFRAWHRGLRELDLLLGRFVENGIGEFGAAHLDQLERLMEVPDQEVLNWVTGQTAVPPEQDTEMFRAMVSYNSELHGGT